MESRNYQLDEARMFADITDGTAIIINSTTGIYYGLNEFGTAIYENLQEGSSTGEILSAVKAIPGVPDQFESLFETFISSLVGFEIVIPVEGKTINELKDEIAAKISSMGYIKEPIVMAKLENFKVSVIGEVNSIITADGESMNLVQAVAQMSIPRESGKINDLMVIRTQDGIRRAYQVNLQSKDLFDSPVYYLQQNDIIYVKPKGLRFSQTGSTIRDFMGSVFSFATSIFYMTYWLAR